MKGIPAESNIFTQVMFSPFVSKSDAPKMFYVKRLEDFSDVITKMSIADSSFLKEAEASYTIRGKVQSKNYLRDGKGAITGATITLGNGFGDKHVINLSTLEISKLFVFSIRNSGVGSTKSMATLGDVKIGDYFSIKRSVNLLDNDEIYIEISTQN